MATRESQGLQIALILLVMITLLLAVTTFVYYRKSEERGKEVAEARQNEAAAKEAFDVAFYKMTALRHLLGAPDDKGNPITEIQVKSLEQSIAPEKLQDDKGFTAIQEDYQKDMAMYGEGLPAESLNYKSLPRHLGDRLRQANQDLTAEAEAQKKLILDKAAFEKQESDRAKAALTAQQKAEADLAAVREQFNQQKAQIDKEKQELADKVATADDRVKSALANYDSQIKQLTTDNTNLKNKSEVLEGRLERQKSVHFERAQGMIAWVNQRERVVWIDLGLADLLRPQMTFSVYDKSATSVGKGEGIKGGIEVLRVIDQHMAEARIVSDQPSNPILRGDLVHTPAWRPGRPVHFALAGLLDVNGDGKSDRELVRNLIRRNGGVIDLELLENGTIEPQDGKLTAETRYLVRGVRPTDRTVPEGMEKYTKLIGEAQTYDIQNISIDEFLNYMGWKGEVETISFGRGAKPEGVLRREGGAAAGASGDSRPRRPPEAGAGGAF